MLSNSASAAWTLGVARRWEGVYAAIPSVGAFCVLSRGVIGVQGPAGGFALDGPDVFGGLGGFRRLA